MIETPKYDFPKVHLPAPARHVRLSELNQALVTERLHGRLLSEIPNRRACSQWTKRFASVRRPHHPVVRSARTWAAAEILSDLQNGSLPTYVSSDQEGAYFEIPTTYWRSAYCGLSVEGSLSDFTEDGIIRARDGPCASSSCRPGSSTVWPLGRFPTIQRGEAHPVGQTHVARVAWPIL